MLRISITTLFVFIGTLTAFTQKVWTLEECIAYAKENNIQIRQSLLNQNLSEAALLQSKLNLLPSINASSGYYFNFGKTIDPTSNLFVTQNTQTNTFDLNASWDIFNGFQRWNTLKQDQYNLEAAKFTTEKSINDISLFVCSAFLSVVFAKEKLQVAAEQLGVSNQQKEQTKILLNAGTVTAGALYQMEAQEANDQLGLVNAQNELNLAMLNLAQLLSINESLDVSVPELNVGQLIFDLAGSTQEEIYSIAESNQPGIKSAQFQLLSADKGLAIARGSLYPSLSLFGGLSTNYSNAYQTITDINLTNETTSIGFLSTDFTPVLAPVYSYVFENVPFKDQWTDNFGQAFGLSLNVPIFNNWITRSNVTSSKVDVLNAQYNMELAKQQLKKDVQNAYANAVAAKNSYEASLQSVTAMQKTFDDAQQRFNLGAINTLDFTTAQKNLAAAKSGALQAKYQYIFNLKVLDFYQGKPLTLQ